MVLVENRRVVIPFIQDVFETIFLNTTSYNRGEHRYELEIIAPTNTIQLPESFKILCEDWLEVYIDENRVINPKIKSDFGGTLYEKFNVNIISRVITFSANITGQIKIVCDTNVPNEEDIDRSSCVITVQNVQGLKSSGISLYHEPVIMTEPENGYARLSFDRTSIIYVPKIGFSGTDQFNYCLINIHGQQSRNRCIRIKVG